MSNVELLKELDGMLDIVDRILLSMDLDKEVKRQLTGLTYSMYAKAEQAIEQEAE